MKNKLPKYDNYKPSNVEWLGEIPQHWEVKKLKYQIKSRTGFAFPSDKFNNELGIPVVRISDLDSDGLVNLIKCPKLPLDYAKFLDKYGLKENDLLFAMTGGTIGKVAIFKSDKSALLNQRVCSFTIENDVNRSIIFYWMQTKYWKEYINLKALGGAQPNISDIDVLNLPIVISNNYEEQEKIAQFLDEKTTKIDKAIEIKQRQIELLKERRQILIHRAVTRGVDVNVNLKDSGVEWIGEIPEHWEVKKLKYILHERNERSITGEEPLFMMSQIHGLVVRSDFHEKAEAAQSSVGNKLVYEKDLVFNKLKAHLGVFFKSNIPQTGIVSPDYAVYYTNGIIEDVKFLEVLFRSPSYIREFICRATGIVEGLIRLYTGDLFDIAVPVPPKQEQRMILAHIENISTKISKAIGLKEREIEVLKEYKSSLINSAVTGKVRVF